MISVAFLFGLENKVVNTGKGKIRRVYFQKIYLT